MRPFAHAEGHDLPWLVDEVVPGLAAQRDDVFVGFEDPVRQPVVAHGCQTFSTGFNSGDRPAAAPGR